MTSSLKKKFQIAWLTVFLCTNLLPKAFSWDSETGSGVVSANETIVRTSLEATEVLQSDTLTNLFGITVLGGTANSASFDSGGVFRTRNVVSSVDVVGLNQNQFLSWIVNVGGSLKSVKVGVSADGTFTAPTLTVATEASANTLAVGTGVLRSSGQTVLVGVSTTTAKISSTLAVSGTTTLVGSLSPLKSTVAALPAVSSSQSYIQLVTDATGAGDCTTGGGSIMNLCITSGSGVWIDA